MENIHKGHRERMKNRYREHGLENFTDIEVLEILLFYALPRCNTNELAHMLLNRFHSFRGVMEAELHELAQVPGIGENAATLIKLVTDMNRRYLAAKRSNVSTIRSTEEAGEYFMPLFAYETDEVVYLACLDGALRVISCRSVARGMPNKVSFEVRDVVNLVLRENATSVILAHNHPSDVALPSKTDEIVTKQLFAALKLIGVELRDHLIICDDDFVSMRDSGLFLQL